jgi:hypothetical protein
MNTLEERREFWADIAKRNGWHTAPFYVQVWQNKAGEIWDSVSHQGMTKDIITIGENYE